MGRGSSSRQEHGGREMLVALFSTRIQGNWSGRIIQCIEDYPAGIFNVEILLHFPTLFQRRNSNFNVDLTLISQQFLFGVEKTSKNCWKKIDVIEQEAARQEVWRMKKYVCFFTLFFVELSSVMFYGRTTQMPPKEISEYRRKRWG